MAERIFPSLLILLLAGAALIGLEHWRHGSPPSRRRADWVKYTVFGIVLAISLSCARGGLIPAAVLLLAISLGCAHEFALTLGRRWMAVPAFACFAASLGHLLAPGPLPLFVSYSLTVLIVAGTDAFAQLVGRLAGKRKLCPRLSPGKTVEGLLGGFVGALVVVFLIGGMGSHERFVRLAMLALLTAAAAVTGDLAFSAVKRATGIKDFSRALPGQGGILDRYDSLVLGAPVGYWVQRLLLE